MAEIILQDNLTKLNAISPGADTVEQLDPGIFVLTLLNDIRQTLVPLSRRQLRKDLLRPLELTAAQTKAIALLST